MCAMFVDAHKDVQLKPAGVDSWPIQTHSPSKAIELSASSLWDTKLTRVGGHICGPFRLTQIQFANAAAAASKLTV